MGTKLKFGLLLPHFGRNASFGKILDGAKRAEEYGFDSVWVTDNIIVPHEIPDRTDIVYRHDMLEPLSLLTHLGAVTKLAILKEVYVEGRLSTEMPED